MFVAFGSAKKPGRV